MLTVKEKYVDIYSSTTMARIAQAAPTWSSERINSRMSQTFIADSNRRSEIFRLRNAECGMRNANRESRVESRGSRIAIFNPQSEIKNQKSANPHSASRIRTSEFSVACCFHSRACPTNTTAGRPGGGGRVAGRQTNKGQTDLFVGARLHLTLGRLLARAPAGLPWVMHFRDPWVTGLREEHLPGNKICYGITRALEPMTLFRADAVVCVTEEHAASMRAAYDQMAASKFAVVMNGFDGLMARGYRIAPYGGAIRRRRAAKVPRHLRCKSLYETQPVASLPRAAHADRLRRNCAR